MSAGRKQRWAILLVLLGLTLGAVAWVSQQEEAAEPVRVAPHVTMPKDGPQGNGQSAKDKPDEALSLNMNRLQREPQDKDDAVSDLFATKSWYVPPPPPKPLPPPPPSPPPMPYAYMGKLVEDGQLTVFLTKQDRNYVVKVGETLDGMYKIESVTPVMMTMVYLPLNMKQTLMIGGE